MSENKRLLGAALECLDLRKILQGILFQGLEQPGGLGDRKNLTPKFHIVIRTTLLGWSLFFNF